MEMQRKQDNTEQKLKEINKEAQDMYKQGRTEQCLVCCRRSLEYILNYLFLIYHLNSEYDIDTLKTIDLVEILRENNIISEKETQFFHNVRKLGNKGAHVNVDISLSPTISDAKLAVTYCEEIYEIFCKKQKIINDELVINIPLPHPNYYFGHLYTGRLIKHLEKDSLYIDDLFIKLNNRAKNGNLESMLDLANAFLPRNAFFVKIIWYVCQNI